MIKTNELEELSKDDIEPFDYSTVDSKTASMLRQHESNLTKLAENTRISVGKELYEAQQELSKHGYGNFTQWFESLGFDRNNVYFWIREFRLCKNLHDQKQIANFKAAPKTVRREMTRRSAPEEAKQAVLNGDIKTHKEYKALEAKLKERDRTIADQQAELEDNRKTQIELNQRLSEANSRQPEPKVVTKTVTKEVKPDDYDTIKAKLAELEKQSAKDQEDVNYYKRELQAAERIHKNEQAPDHLEEMELKRLKRDAQINAYKVSLDTRDWTKKLQQITQEDIRNMGEEAQNNLRTRLDSLQSAIDNVNAMFDGPQVIEGEINNDN